MDRNVKYYNNNNKLQALLHLTKAINSIPIDDGSHGEINLYNNICYILGNIYIDMGIFDKAYYYLLHDMIEADEDSDFAKDLLNMINGENSEQELN